MQSLPGPSLTVLPLIGGLLVAGLLPGRSGGQGKEERPPRIPAVLHWEKHRGLPVAELQGRPVRLGDLASHLKAHYDPGVEERWKDRRELNSPHLPELLNQYLDVLALRAEVESRKLPMKKLMERVDQYLKGDFEGRYLPLYEKEKGRKPEGADLEYLRTRHRRELGLSFEVRALLDLAVPGFYKVSELYRFNTDHGHFFGGKIKIFHIFFSTRDPATGRLFPESKQIETRSRIREVLMALEKDPSRFEALAGKYSDDKVTGPLGGEIGFVRRFEKGLPAVVLRTAWRLEYGEVSEPVESYFGFHIVTRRKFIRNHFILFRGAQIKKVADFRKELEAEDFLFEMRRKRPRKLYL